MDHRIASNKALWNELTTIHEESKFYDVDSFLNGKSTLKSIELGLLGSLNEKSLLHMQCHFGMDTLSLARLGAQVTGVDLSEKSIEVANKLAKKIKQENANFICSNIYDLDTVNNEKFDIVFTSYGVLCWLNDLDKWAKTIFNHLKSGGIFVIVEEHPLANIFEQVEDNLEIQYSYFDKKTLELKVDGSYASRTAKIRQTVSYEWLHTLSEITNSLIENGLTIKQLNEYPFSMYQKFECMKEVEEGWWIYPEAPELPLLFSIVASKS